MFNLGELQLIWEWATKYKHECEESLNRLLKQPDPFDHLTSSKVYQANELDQVNTLLAKVQAELEEQGRTDLISLDADNQGELLVLCAKLHSAWNQEFADTQSTNTQDILDAYYLLGNIEGRLKAGRVTLEDLGMLEAWEEEMEA